MTKFNLNSVKESLSREEMREISGGTREVLGIVGTKKQNAITIRCKNGTTSASTTNSTMEAAESYAASLCHGGGYSIVCVGDC